MRIKLRPIGPNQTELDVGDVTILFSYRTPVAFRSPKGCFRTEQHYSVTTSRHINQWIGPGAQVVPQSQIDDCLEVKE